MLKYAFILGLIATVSASILAFTYEVTKEPIAMELRKDFLAGLLEVLPPDFDNEPDEDIFVADGMQVYNARKDGIVTGFAMQTTSMRGYSGEIAVLVGYRNDEIYAVRVIKHAETPGLGDKITDRSWLAEFQGVRGGEMVYVKPDGGEIDSFSGATISPRAVCDAVNKAQAVYRRIGNE